MNLTNTTAHLKMIWNKVKEVYFSLTAKNSKGGSKKAKFMVMGSDISKMAKSKKKCIKGQA